MNASSDTAIAEAQIVVGVEEKLCDGSRRASIDLLSQVIEIGLRRWRLGMSFRIGGDGNVEIGNRAQARHQIRRVGVTVRMRLVLRYALGRITSQGHDMANPLTKVLPRNLEHFLARGPDASQMRCASQ